MGSRSHHNVAQRRALLPFGDEYMRLVMQTSHHHSNRAQRRRACGILRRCRRFIKKWGG